MSSLELSTLLQHEFFTYFSTGHDSSAKEFLELQGREDSRLRPHTISPPTLSPPTAHTQPCHPVHLQTASKPHRSYQSAFKSPPKAPSPPSIRPQKNQYVRSQSAFNPPPNDPPSIRPQKTTRRLQRLDAALLPVVGAVADEELLSRRDLARRDNQHGAIGAKQPFAIIRLSMVVHTTVPQHQGSAGVLVGRDLHHGIMDFGVLKYNIVDDAMARTTGKMTTTMQLLRALLTSRDRLVRTSKGAPVATL